MKNKTIRFLLTSLIFVFVLCGIVFTIQAVRMNKRSAETIYDIGEIYMSGMSDQIRMHFGTIIESRLSQVEALVDTVSPESLEGSDTVRVLLTYNARARGFDSLAFYLEDGTFEMVYGNLMDTSNADSFMESLGNGEEKMVMGTDAMEENIVLVGVPAGYLMSDGSKSVALVAGFSVEYISQTISTGLDSSMQYLIINRSGEVVIQNDGQDDHDYYEKVKRNYGQTEEQGKLEHYIVNLKSAMASGEEYTDELTLSGERCQLYCSALPYSDWYLILSMPYSTLDRTIDEFGEQWVHTAVINGLIILLMFLLVFGKYLQLTRQQMRAMDEARIAAERANKAKSEFLSNMSHDIRTPMNGIVGMTSIAIGNISDEQQVENCLKKISISSRHLLGLINDILDMSKIESGKMTLNVNDVSLRETMQSITNIIQPQTKEKKQKFEIYIYDILTEHVCCDSVRLNQVLLNLLGNAVKFTPEGGTIQLLLYQEASAKGDTHVRMHLHVKDNGIGMTPEFREKIFESFMREDNARIQKIEGAGLGMSITKYIVDAMGGTIEVDSEVGKGSEFHVTLDLERASVPKEDMTLPEWKALVIDNDRRLCECVVSDLKTIGVCAQWVSDSESALGLLKEQQEKNDDYQVILLGRNLQEMNGILLAREIRRRFGDAYRILMISEYDYDGMEDEASAAGINGFVVRPLFKSALYESLKAFTEDGGEKTQQKESSGTEFSGQHILLAEDIELNWEIANELLSEAGLVLEWAENGQICVDKFSKSPSGYYSAILMDIRMPVMTGYEAARAIRALEREDAGSIPIIAMSADAFSDDIQKCLECGMNAHVAKPIDVAEVLHQLKKYMRY